MRRRIICMVLACGAVALLFLATPVTTLGAQSVSRPQSKLAYYTQLPLGHASWLAVRPQGATAADVQMAAYWVGPDMASDPVLGTWLVNQARCGRPVFFLEPDLHILRSLLPDLDTPDADGALRLEAVGIIYRKSHPETVYVQGLRDRSVSDRLEGLRQITLELGSAGGVEVMAPYERYVATKTSVLDDYPNGKSTLRISGYIIWDDGNTSYDFWTFKVTGETVPGYVLNNNNWFTVRSKPGSKMLDNGLVLEYAPTSSTIYGYDTVSGSIGFDDQVSASVSWSTIIPTSYTENISDISVELTRWHNYFSADCQWATFALTPVTNARVNQNDNPRTTVYNYAVFDHLLYLARTLSASPTWTWTKPSS